MGNFCLVRRFAMGSALLYAVFLTGCKTREPDQSGLLAADAERAEDEEAVADGGEFAVRCAPADDAAGPEGGNTTAESYLLQVKGAVSATDESQPLVVDLDVTAGGEAGKMQRLFAAQRGRGVIDLQKSIFIGFENGVLTADALEGETGGFTGVLSVAGRVDGMPVKCQAKGLAGI